jgi:hypothetical protein
MQAKGTIVVTEGINESDNDILTSTTLTAFAPQGVIFSDGKTTSACSITAFFKETDSIDGTYACEGANASETGSFLVYYRADLYEQPSSLNRAAGTWVAVDFNTTNNNIDMALTVDESDGSIDGSNDDGCVYSGEIGIIDPAFNLYDINITAELCSFLNGTFSGLASVKQNDPDADELSYQIDNDTGIITQVVLQFK